MNGILKIVNNQKHKTNENIFINSRSTYGKYWFGFTRN
ncbi:hypothetical protein GGE08_000663 [Muricauda sp. ARW1Y1]|jgi:hypothetical protein|nr:hypothetical protein [Muricauda sp. ARW1Y1]